MTAVQLTLDECQPDQATDPGDHQPTRFDCRQHEMRDLQDQGVGPYALWTAETVDTQEKYL